MKISDFQSQPLQEFSIGDYLVKRRTAAQTRDLASQAQKQWAGREAQLQAAAGPGKPIDPTRYEDTLADFVQRVMLANRRITDLDDASEIEIERAIGDIIAARGNAGAMEEAWLRLTQQSLVAREDLAKSLGQRGSTGGSASASASSGIQMSPQVAAQVVARLMTNQRINPDNFKTALKNLLGEQPITITRTNNVFVNALLTQLGITVR